MITITIMVTLIAFAVLVLAPISAGVAMIALDLAIAIGVVTGIVKLFSKKKGS